MSIVENNQLTVKEVVTAITEAMQLEFKSLTAYLRGCLVVLAAF